MANSQLTLMQPRTGRGVWLPTSVGAAFSQFGRELRSNLFESRAEGEVELFDRPAGLRKRGYPATPGAGREGDGHPAPHTASKERTLEPKEVKLAPIEKN